MTAGPPSASYRINKFIRRNRWPVTAAVLVLLTLAVGFVATGVAYVEAVDARVAEQKERMRADHGVQTSVLYPALHELSAYAELGRRPLPRAEAVGRAQVTLPLFPHLDEARQDLVVEALRAAL